MSANPLASTLAALLESAARAALATSAEARQTIAELDGQTLLLELRLELPAWPNLPPLGIRINCQQDGLTIMADSPHNTRAPHAIVRGNLPDVIRALWSEDLPAGVSIDGDERLLIALKRCFRELAPDWRERLEAFMARFSPSAQTATKAATNTTGQFMQDILGQAELAFDTLRTTFGEALKNTGEQAKDAASSFWAKEDDLDKFATRLENLQLEVDRLNAQADHLLSSKGTTEGTSKGATRDS